MHKKSPEVGSYIANPRQRSDSSSRGYSPTQNNACQRYAYNNRRTIAPHQQKHKKRAPEGLIYRLPHDKGATAPVVGIRPQKNNACQRYAYNNRRITPPHKQKCTKRAPEGLIYRLTHDRGATAPVVGIAHTKKTRAIGTRITIAVCIIVILLFQGVFYFTDFVLEFFFHGQALLYHLACVEHCGMIARKPHTNVG